MTAALGMPRPGDLIAGKYRLTEELGRGSMGIVYGATHDVTGKRVAVKVLFPAMAASEISAERFLREAKAACRIEHPNVVNVYDAGRDDGGRLFLVMELLRGEPLSAVLERGPQDPERFIEDFMPVLRGVAAAHAVGVVHRDLKPENIFMTIGRLGYDGDPKVLDFGISKLSGTSARSTPITMDGTIMGTPYYMAPEQILSSKSVDERADVYSLGVILYQALVGDLPFNADNLHALFLKIASGKIRSARELRPDLDPDLERVLMRALATDPAKRYQTVESLAFALEPFGEGASFSRPQRLMSSPVRASMPSGGGGSTDSGMPLPFETDPKLELGDKTHGDIALPAALEAAAAALEESEPLRAPGQTPRTRNSEIEIDVDLAPAVSAKSDPPSELEGPPTQISRFEHHLDVGLATPSTDPEIDTKTTDPAVRRPADAASRGDTVALATDADSVAIHRRPTALLATPSGGLPSEIHRKPTQLLPDRAPRPVQEVDRRERKLASPTGSPASRRVGGSTLPFGTPSPTAPAAGTGAGAGAAARAPVPPRPRPSAPGPAPAAPAQAASGDESSVVLSQSLLAPPPRAPVADVADTDSYDVPPRAHHGPTVLDVAPPMGHLEEVVARAMPSSHTELDLPPADLSAARAADPSAGAATVLDLTPPVVDEATYFTRRRRQRKRRVPVVVLGVGLVVLALLAGALAFVVASQLLGR